MKRFLLLFVLLAGRMVLFGQVNFTYDNMVGCGPMTVSFQGHVADSITVSSRIWYFGDGDSSLLENPVHVYTTPGNYTVYLNIWYESNGVVKYASASKSGFTVIAPKLDIGKDYLVCTAIDPDNKITIKNKLAPAGDTAWASYHWSTGDTTPTISVNTPQTYYVSYNACGETLEDSTNVYVSSSPMQLGITSAGWTNEDYRVAVSANIPFNRKAIKGYYVNWGDGYTQYWDANDVTDYTQFIRHYSYPQKDTYHIVLSTSLKEPNGYCDTTARYDQVVQPSLVKKPDWSNKDTVITSGDTLLVDAGNAIGYTSYKWFKNGEGPTGDTGRIKKITEPGRYRVLITMLGDVRTDTISVQVKEPTKPKAHIGFVNSVCNNVWLADSSTVTGAEIVYRFWSFGDYSYSSTVVNPTHVYTKNGSYEVRLVVTNNLGETDTAYRVIDMQANPEAKLGPDTTINQGSITLGTGNSPGSDFSYRWSTGDTSRTITVDRGGVYWVRVSASQCGTDAVAYDTIQVFPLDTVPVVWMDAGATFKRVGCSTYQFTDTTKVRGGHVTSWEWTFSDGTVDSTQNPVHTFSAAQAANYATLKVKSDFGDSAFVYYTLWVFTTPYVSLDTSDFVELKPEGTALGRYVLGPEYSYQYLWSTGDTTHTIIAKQPGTYWLRVTDNLCGGTSGSDTMHVIGNNNMSAAFNMDSIKCNGVYFSDRSTFASFPIVKWEWDFGDGAKDTVPNPIHKYAGNGAYNISLKVTSSSGYQDSTTSERRLQILPALNLGNDTTLAPGDSLMLNAEKPEASWFSTYLWSTGQTIPYIYVKAPGTYWVTLASCDVVLSDTIVISSTIPDTLSRPNAQFTANKLQCATVQFTDESTTPAGTTITYRQWNFGDNTTDTAINPLHTYSQRGTYAISLLVENSNGERDTAFTTVYFSPIAVNLGADTTLAAGDSLALDARRPEKLSDATYLWSTGDTTPVKIVFTPGNYWVNVTSCGTTVTDTIHISLTGTPPPDTGFLEAGLAIWQTACRTYQFTDTSKVTAGYISRRIWQFGDNTTDTLQNPVHIYGQSGTYIVKLLVEDNVGQQDSTSAILTINSVPVVNLGPDIDTLHPGGFVQLNAFYPAAVNYSFQWSTGDTTQSITVTQPGTYALKVTDRWCCTSAADTIIISAAIPAENPADIGTTTTVNASDSLTVTASFDHSFNNNNIFTIQLLQGTSTGGKKAGEQEGEVTNLATIAGTDPRIAVKVTIPDTIPCGQDYHVRIVSSSPADTTDWSAKFAVVNTPVAAVQQRGDSLFASKALTYQWYYNGAALTGATAAAIRAKVNGQYYVVVSNGGSCRSTSATVNMVITAVPDVNLGENIVRAFPNPTAGLVYIRFEKPLLKPVNVIVHDARGNTLYRKQVKDQLTAIDLGTLPKGVYYLELAGYGKQKAMRIILQ